ncbi:exonuclease [Candidatus Woesearchaeota archaeon CG_4_10_14_0_2_um_filter_33_13]|nr:MAG: exonuclease [Candidatus Woesearchaeota archaeon CG_4_10_14_0_2_um_filter_33_13]
MLTNSFIHIPGINKQKEVELWQNDILTWQEFLQRQPKHSQVLQESIQAKENKDHHFFLKRLPNNEHWRVYKEFKTCFLDIETTGLSRDRDDLTLIGLYDGQESKIFINGKNLNHFPEEIAKYQTIVTFNGKCFDVPFLKAKFPGLNLEKFHIDLRYVMKDLGYFGGLKKIERELGIQRDDDLQDVNGFEAVRLWYKYKRGSEEALNLLVKYNLADIENLKTLADFTYEKMRERNFHSNLKY